MNRVFQPEHIPDNFTGFRANFPITRIPIMVSWRNRLSPDFGLDLAISALMGLSRADMSRGTQASGAAATL